MIMYGVELLQKISSPVVVVVGAYGESVKQALESFDVVYANQPEQLGTGHAVTVGIAALLSYSPEKVLVGYGDHMMFYSKKTIKQLLKKHEEEKATVSLITTLYDRPDELAWGRIIRDENRNIINVVEQKDAAEDQRGIKELNAGFYCFNYEFLKDASPRLAESPVTNEYYINDYITIAAIEGRKVIGFQVPFNEVGIGINKPEELESSQNIFRKTHNNG